jgi:hypothetical protein
MSVASMMQLTPASANNIASVYGSSPQPQPTLHTDSSLPLACRANSGSTSRRNVSNVGA